MAIEYRTPVDASIAFSQDAVAHQLLLAAGWDFDVLNNTNNNVEFGVFHRAQRWAAAAAQVSNSFMGLTASPKKSPVQSAGSNASLGAHSIASTPTPVAPPFSGTGLTPFDPMTLPTLARIRRDEERLVLAVDTEFYYPGGPRSRERKILTWQFSFVEPADTQVVHSLVFFSYCGARLGLGRAISYCLSRFGLLGQLRDLDVTKCPDNGYAFRSTREWVVPLKDTHGALWDGYRFDRSSADWGSFGSLDDAVSACKDPDFLSAYSALKKTRAQPSRIKLKREVSLMPDGKLKDLSGRGLAGYVNNFSPYHRDGLAVPVTILCHAGKADLSAFSFECGEKDVLRQLSEVQGGLVSMRDFTMNVALTTGAYWRFFPLSVCVRDTMCFAPAGHKSLGELGEAVGFSKLSLKPGYSKDAMQDYLSQEPVAFMEYASRDSEVTARFAGTLFGYNRAMPVTASSAAVTSIVETIKDDWGLNGNAEFNSQWRGLTRVATGKKVSPDTGKLVQTYRNDAPVSADAELLQTFARNSYKGGANGCSFVGWVDGITHDLDLCSAYPTAMSCVFDVDWQADKLITREWIREDALLQDFRSPFDPIWAYVDEFEFPEDVLYPCIAVNVDGCITFPRTLGCRDGVYVTGVEIWLALKLGARVHIARGFQARYRIDGSGVPTRSLFKGVREFVNDRAVLKGEIKAGRTELSVFEQLEKTMVNSSYGKTAQNVVEKTTWDARSQEMVDLGMSRITSPTHASMTTAIVRCILMAAMNELASMGYDSYSFTTDGFITTADEDTANALPLCGMAPYLHQVRLDLSGSPKVWEEKHLQSGFYNLTTRGNMSPDSSGVCAHNSYVSPFPSKSAEDRLHCLDAWLSRTSKVDCTVGVWARYKDMADAVTRDDFFVEDRPRSLSMDFDLKRKPVRDSINTVRPVIAGRFYEVANVATVPYESPEEYELYKSRGKSCKCLRTEGEWLAFFSRVASAASGIVRHVSDYDWSRIFTCVMGHRLGIWHIPALDDDSKSVADKCRWINTFNDSSKVFKESHWKNARRQERQSQMLDRSEVADLLGAMGAVLS